MVYSSMVHVAGGEEGSIRHDDDGHPAPSGGSPVPEGRWVHDEQVATMIDMNRLRELTADLGFMPATIDEADIERHRQHNKPRRPGQFQGHQRPRRRRDLLERPSYRGSAGFRPGPLQRGAAGPSAVKGVREHPHPSRGVHELGHLVPVTPRNTAGHKRSPDLSRRVGCGADT
jgi:hypothetical protein